VLVALKWIRKPAATMEEAHATYGDVWTLRLLAGTNFVFVSDPKLIEQVFTADDKVIHGGDANMIATALLGENSVLLLDEVPHMTQRKLLLPPFHGDRVQRYHDTMARICEEEIATWPIDEPMSLLPRMQTITLNVIMSAIFGVSGGERQDALRARIRAQLDWGDNPMRMGRLHLTHRRGKEPPKSFLAVRDPLDATIFEEIELARRDPRLEERDDILALLVQARHDDGSPMSDREIRDEMITLLIQGHTSTATALSWALERLMRHPEVFEKLRAEAQNSNGDGEYVDAVFKETLRVRPPLPMTARRVNQPFRLGEYDLEVGTLIAACIYLVHRREDLYPDPERFRPERFLEQKTGTYTWIPFGGGDRHCIGRSFATAEIKAVLTTLARNTRLEPAEQADETIRRRGILFSPSDGARAVLRERVPAPGAPKVAA
jgi:cytochrome P450